MTDLGIIGSGNIGTAVARLAVAAGLDVVIANSRGPESLSDKVDELGPRAAAGTVEEAAGASDTVLLTVPLTAAVTLPSDLFADKIVLDTSNYYPSRDGRIAELDDNELTTSELVQKQLRVVRYVKAFNNIFAPHIPQLARPHGAPDRTALPLAGDHPDAKAEASRLLDRLGFDSFDAGSLADSWRIEPESAGYTQIYFGPDTPSDSAPDGAPLSADALQRALEGVERVNVADRTF